jgi:hypothetical protein
MAGIPRKLRAEVRRRAGRCCEYCRMPELAVYASFHCDHFRPKADRGETIISNLVWACPLCNEAKRERRMATDPRTKLFAPLFNPRVDNWEEHFAWGKDKLMIRGRTAKGRATVKLLGMNRTVAKHLRFLLILSEEHPADS